MYNKGRTEKAEQLELPIKQNKTKSDHVKVIQVKHLHICQRLNSTSRENFGSGTSELLFYDWATKK